MHALMLSLSIHMYLSSCYACGQFPPPPAHLPPLPPPPYHRAPARPPHLAIPTFAVGSVIFPWVPWFFPWVPRFSPRGFHLFLLIEVNEEN